METAKYLERIQIELDKMPDYVSTILAPIIH